MEEYDYKSFYSKHEDYDMNRLYSILDTYHNEMALSKTAPEMREFYTKIDIIRKIIEDNEEKNPIKFNDDTHSIKINEKYYPKINDERFRNNLFKHREFKDCKYDNDTKNQYLTTMSHDTFKNIYQRFPWQEFVKNYMAPTLPYNGILLWWDVGVGKTCGAVSIAEQYKDYLNSIGKKIHVILPGSKLENNWINEICNIDLDNIDKQCTGNSYIDMLSESDFIDIDKLKIKVKRNVKKYYNFVGYGTLQNELNNYIKNSIKLSDNMGPYIKHLQRTYNDTVIIIDEVHELRRDYRTSSSTENDDDLSDDENTKEKIIPKQFHDLIEDIIRHCTGIKLILMSGTPMYDNWKEMIWLIDLLRKNDKLSPIVPFEESLITIDVETPEKYTGHIREKKINITPYISYMSGENPQTYPRKYFASNKYIEEDKGGKYSIGDTPKTPEKDENAKLYIYTTETNIKIDEGNAKKRFFKENLNVDKVSDYFLFKMTGKPILWEIKIGNEYEEQKLYNPANLSEGNILSPKISSIIKIADDKNTGNGIHFIYSEYLQYGVYPMALALELEGYTMAYIDNGKLSYRSLIDNIEVEDRKKIKTGYNNDGGTKGHYILLTGAVSDNDLIKLINEAKGIGISGIDNKNGEHIKFVLGSSKVEVGFSLWNVRHVHIMEPWYNFSKIDQVIGRSLRSNSHKQLDKTERDVVIYHHMLYDNNNIENNLGFKYYTRCIEKEADINKIGKFLKEKAVDYILNYNQNYNKQYIETDKTGLDGAEYIFSDDNNDPRKKVYNKTVIKEAVDNDKDDTSICESLYNRHLNVDKYYDYKTKLVETYICDELFDNNYIYSLEEIKSEIGNETCILNNFNFHKNDTEKQRYIYLYKALYNLVNNKTKFFNGSNIEGYIIVNNNYFIFQPTNLIDKNAPMIYRTGKIENIVDYIPLNKLNITQIPNIIKNENLKTQDTTKLILIKPSQKDIKFIHNDINIKIFNEKPDLYCIENIFLKIIKLGNLPNGLRYNETLFCNTISYINEANIDKKKFNDDINKIRKYFNEIQTPLSKIDIKIDGKDDIYFIFLLLCSIYGYNENESIEFEKNMFINDLFKKNKDNSPQIYNKGNNKHILHGNKKYINISTNNANKITVDNFFILGKGGEVFVYTYNIGNKQFEKKILTMRDRDRNQRDEKTLAYELSSNNELDNLYEIYMSYGVNTKDEITERVSIRYFKDNSRNIKKIDRTLSKSVVCSTNTNDKGRLNLVQKIKSYIDENKKFYNIDDIKMRQLKDSTIKINDLCKLYYIISLMERIDKNLSDGDKSITIYYPNELLYK